MSVYSSKTLKYFENLIVYENADIKPTQKFKKNKKIIRKTHIIALNQYRI